MRHEDEIEKEITNSWLEKGHGTWYESIIHDHPKLFCNLKYFECHAGWAQLLTDLCDKLEKIISDLSIPDNHHHNELLPHADQVKEKFGCLRFYMSDYTNEIRNVIEQAEELSSVTCETCGAPGKKVCKGVWIYTRCKKCWEDMDA